MTKADVLDTFEDLSICTSYSIDGKPSDQIPFQMTWNKIDPQYQQLKGWGTDISSIRNEKDLPMEMKEYVNFINKNLGTPIRFISNGPGRDQIIKSGYNS
jgi:adenylosuccinate synthase